MSIYYIASPEEILDPEAMIEYAENSAPVIEAFGGRFLVRFGEAQALSGSWSPERSILIEFPSRERMVEWYDSEEYRPWRELRERSCRASIVVVEDEA